ncbi:MAG: transposase [Candidatus Competibacter sp.]
MERALTQDYPTPHRVQLHLAVDAENHEVIAVELTAAFVGDAEVLPELLDQPPTAKSVVSMAADGVYDTQVCHRAVLGTVVTRLKI